MVQVPTVADGRKWPYVTGNDKHEAKMTQVDLHRVVRGRDVRSGCICVVVPLTNGECSIKRVSILAGVAASQGQDTLPERGKVDTSLLASKQF